MAKYKPYTIPKLNGTLLPAYGRDYTNKTAVIQAFQKGLDFEHVKLGGFKYCSIRDAKAGDLVKIRYDKERKVVFYRVTDSDLKL